MISDSELSELISVPKEWRLGEEKISWPRTHEKFNLEWLERLWKYLCEYCTSDLTALENFNIIYYATSNNSVKNSNNNKTVASFSSSSNLVLYKLSKSSNLVYTPLFAVVEATTTNSNSNDLTEETYISLIRILNKLGFQCIDSLSAQILSHPLFSNYVPNIRTNRVNLLKALRNKYKHSPSSAASSSSSSYSHKLIQDCNQLLNDSDIKLLQLYLSRIEITSTAGDPQQQQQTEEKGLCEFLKEVPLFENSALECSDRYLPLKDASLIYDAPVRLPFELTGLKPFLCVAENEAKLLIVEKLSMPLVRDFAVVIREIVKYCTADRDLYFLNNVKIHLLGKWLLLNCASYFSSAANNAAELVGLVKSAKLFLNQNQELCAASQFINPTSRENFLTILDARCLPAKDLHDDKCLSVLKDLKMRNCLQLKVDEVIDLYESSLKQNDAHRKLLAELIVEILKSRVQEAVASNNSGNCSDLDACIDKILNEYSTAKAVTLRHFLMSVGWIPLQRDRPVGYPQSLLWKGSEATATTVLTNGLNTSPPQVAPVRFSSPRDCVSAQFALCAGSVVYVSELDMPVELRTHFELKQTQLELVVRHLKVTTRCFDSAASKAEWYDYLTVCKRCYEFMGACGADSVAAIQRELSAHDLADWIWNGAGFSALSSVFLITDREHPLCAHVATLPYELYVFVEFFERLGVRKWPDAKQLEQILLRCVRNSQKLVSAAAASAAAAAGGGKFQTPPVSGNNHVSVDQTQQVLENAAKNFPLINWIKVNFSTESKLLSIIKDYEER